jgi:4-amino-4-deoxy-L-arabinose transferase-like glycosyltransferase
LLPRLTTAQWAVVLALVITLCDLLWVLRDHTAPSWDQSHYLFLTWTYQQSLDHHGPIAMIRALYDTDPSRAPLLSLAMLPFAYVLGQGPGMGLALNLVLWPVLLVSCGAIAKECFGERARLLAIILLAPMPLVVMMSHTALQDFLLLTLATWCVLLLLRTRQFKKRSASIGFGLLFALGMLTKVSFFLLVAGPLLVTLAATGVAAAQARRTGERGAVSGPLSNIVIAGAVALAPTLLWYVPTWGPTLAFLRLQDSPEAGWVYDPLSPSHLASFLIMLGTCMSWLLVGLAAVVGLLSLPRLGRGRESPGRGPLLWKSAFLATWFLIPICFLATQGNQDPRYDLASYPALAVITAGLAAGFRRREARTAVAVLAVLFALVQILEIDAGVSRFPLLPASVSVSTPDGAITVQFGGADGPAGPPSASNLTVQMMQYLESKSRGPGGRLRPEVIDLLELQPFLNGNDLTYYAAVRHDPFTFVTLDGGMSRAEVAATVRRSDFSLYVRQPAGLLEGRIAELNAVDGARLMTPALFALFDPHPARFFVGSVSGQGPYVYVLQRR